MAISLDMLGQNSTISPEGSVIMDVDRPMLRVYLARCGVHISKADCDAMTKEQASLTWDWMENHQDTSAGEYLHWRGMGPDFLVHQTILRKDQPETITTETEESPVAKLAVAFHSLDHMLSQNIKKTIGKEAFNRSKDIGEPLGMSEIQLQSIRDSTTGIDSVEAMEKFMRTDSMWSRKIAGFGPTTIHRLVATLAAFRDVYPMGSDPE